MQDFNHAINPDQRAMTPHEVVLPVRHAEIKNAVMAVDIAMDVIDLQTRKPIVTVVEEPQTSNPHAENTIDIYQKLQDIYAQAEESTPIATDSSQGEVIDIAQRLRDANQPNQPLQRPA